MRCSYPAPATSEGPRVKVTVKQSTVPRCTQGEWNDIDPLPKESSLYSAVAIALFIPNVFDVLID